MNLSRLLFKGISRQQFISQPPTLISTPFQVANFSKYISKSRAKRLPLTTKRAGKGYYKGKGGRKEGHITSKAKFIKDIRRCTELVVPDLKLCTLKPYVGPGAKRDVREASVSLG